MLHTQHELEKLGGRVWSVNSGLWPARRLECDRARVTKSSGEAARVQGSQVEDASTQGVAQTSVVQGRWPTIGAWCGGVSSRKTADMASKILITKVGGYCSNSVKSCPCFVEGIVCLGSGCSDLPRLPMRRAAATSKRRRRAKREKGAHSEVCRGCEAPGRRRVAALPAASTCHFVVSERRR